MKKKKREKVSGDPRIQKNRWSTTPTYYQQAKA